MYFLILLPKPLIHIHLSNHTSRKMIAKICLDNFIEMYLKIYTALKIKFIQDYTSLM